LKVSSPACMLPRYLHARTLTWLLFRLNATSYVSWLQGQKGRTLSPLRLGTAGMILSEQTSNTTSNTLHGVRHRFFSSFSPAGFLGRSIFTVSVSLLSDAVFSFGPPLLRLVGAPFAPVGTYLLAPPCPASPSLVLTKRLLNLNLCICP